MQQQPLSRENNFEIWNNSVSNGATKYTESHQQSDTSEQPQLQGYRCTQ